MDRRELDIKVSGLIQGGHYKPGNTVIVMNKDTAKAIFGIKDYEFAWRYRSYTFIADNTAPSDKFGVLIIRDLD
jgi:hypothetical protein